MRLKNDADGRNFLDETIQGYYRSNGNRRASNFLHSKDEEWGWSYSHFLLEQKIIFRYGIGEDRGVTMGGLQLAIGPHYFGPADFWSYENSQRFRLGTEVDDVLHNLGLLDEFLGNEDTLKRAHGWRP